MSLSDVAAEVLGANGTLAGNIAGFESRAGQITLARHIAEAIDSRQHLIAEAGTGIGKTFAYLVPILLAHRRALISTATRALQDQLYERDLPLVARALGRPLRVAVLKGRRNYLCRERYRRFVAEGPELELGGAMEMLVSWARATRTGDFVELPMFGENSQLPRRLSVGPDACLGADCREFARCHVFAARREAQAADVVVVNHHLLIADFVMKSEGTGDILGDMEVFVVDEAHALAQVARLALGEHLTSAELAELAVEATETLGTEPAGAAHTLVTALQREASGGGRGRYARADAGFLNPVLEEIGKALRVLLEDLQSRPGAEGLVARVVSAATRLESLGEQSEDSETFVWLEIDRRGQFALHRSPITLTETLGGWIADTGASWILTSATLAVGGRFEPVAEELGLHRPHTVLIDSPFDYVRQARLYLPRGLPDVDDPTYTQAVIRAAEPLVQAAEGGSFLLFTSRRAMTEAASLVRSRRWPYPLFIQDEAPRARLLEQFRAAGNGVLVGTSSFWGGVDVKGDALVLVVIDRLPFDSPADPLLRARLAQCRRLGGNPFTDIQLSEAVMTLKQGAGRLIRDAGDRGVLMICDPRLRSRHYGATFLASLPPMPVVEELALACEFLARAERRGRACL